MTDELFDALPGPGETVDVDLGSGLRARVPIALYSKDGHTIGDAPEVAVHTQAAPLGASSAASSALASAAFDVVAGAADVIVVWNVLEHFWPYWNIISVNWNAELDAALADALDDRSVDDHVRTLQRHRGGGSWARRGSPRPRFVFGYWSGACPAASGIRCVRATSGQVSVLGPPRPR